jgi:phage terminase large subunit-like protein
MGPILLSCVLPGKPGKLTEKDQESFLLSENLKHKLGFERQISDTWLQWFIGFAEGDGAILSYQGQPQFVITQKEGKILYEIQSLLGFGTVRYFPEGEGFYRYIVTDTKSILILCLLFNGNLVLPHRVGQLGQWIIDLNVKLTSPKSRIYQLIPLITAITDTTKPSLKDAWLSGFTDAECTFNVNITERLNTVTGFRVQLRFLLDQNNAYDTFMYIRDLFGSGKVTHRGETKNVYRLTINTFTGLSSVCAYFAPESTIRRI